MKARNPNPVDRAHIVGLQIVTAGVLAFAFIFSNLRQAVFAQSFLAASSTATEETAVPAATGSEAALLPEASDTAPDASAAMDSETLSPSGTIIVDPKYVLTDTDLESYIRGILATDTRITAIETATTSVSVSTENEPATLLGFISITIPVTLTAEADGTVSLSHPEHSFVVKPASDDQIRASASLQTKPYAAGPEASSTPHTKALMIAALQATIDAIR